MEITVLFFSLFRDSTGTDQRNLTLPEGETSVAEVLEQIYEIYPKLREWDSRMLVARNCEYADRTEKVVPGDELALMPPVQGG